MSHREIVAELPTLKAAERADLLKRLCDLQERDLLQGAGPTDAEKRVLDHALAQFEQDRDLGIPWRQALEQVKKSARE